MTKKIKSILTKTNLALFLSVIALALSVYSTYRTQKEKVFVDNFSSQMVSIISNYSDQITIISNYKDQIAQLQQRIQQLKNQNQQLMDASKAK